MTIGIPGPRDQLGSGGGKLSFRATPDKKAARKKARAKKRQGWRDLGSGHERAGWGSDQR